MTIETYAPFERICALGQGECGERSRRGARAERRGHSGLLGGTRLDRGRLLRDPFLQQELGRLDPRVRMESVDHHVIQENVRERHQRHPLVVSEVRLHDDPGSRTPRGQALRVFRLSRRVVDRIVVAERSQRTRFLETPEIPRGFRGVHHRGERGGVRSHHELVRQAALQTEARNPECLVLEVPQPVHEVERRLGDSPRNAAPPAVPDLMLHRHLARLVEERAGIGPHEEERHQIFEQGRAPRDERRDAVRAHHEAPEAEPVALRHVALGDGEEARETSLGGEQVVVGRVQSAGPADVGEPVADREELALAVVEEAEAHPVRERLRPLGQARKPRGGGVQAFGPGDTSFGHLRGLGGRQLPAAFGQREQRTG